MARGEEGCRVSTGTPDVQGRERRIARIILAMAAFAVFAIVAVALSRVALADTPSELPPISVTNITFSDDAPTEGDAITITVTVHNNGTSNYTGVALTVAYDRTNITTVKNLTVPAMGNVTVDVPWKAVKFTHVMTAVPIVEGFPLEKGLGTQALTVAAKPIGDSPTVAAALVVVLLVFVGSVAAPSVWERLSRRG
jgi:hypothetical protein